MADVTAFPTPFDNAAQRREADRFGMLIFLASEIMLFGGIFGAALVLRLTHPSDYVAAAGRLDVMLGTINTAILLTSSLGAALAVELARSGKPRGVAVALVVTVLLGVAFLGVKALEYAHEYREGLMPGTAHAHFATRGTELFVNLYFVATGLHAVHVAIGLGLLMMVAANARARRDRRAVLLGNAALYWHLVDIVWVFLYPTLYLAGIR